jgi:Spy/CpxP family protein refolding chaperone
VAVTPNVAAAAGWGRTIAPAVPWAPAASAAAAGALVDPRQLADYLQLDDAQRQQAREILATQRDTMRPLMEQGRSLREHLAQLLDDPQADSAALGNLVQQLHANRQQIEGARKGLDSKLSAILNPAQREKLTRLRTVMEDLRRGDRGARRDRR